MPPGETTAQVADDAYMIHRMRGGNVGIFAYLRRLAAPADLMLMQAKEPAHD